MTNVTITTSPDKTEAIIRIKLNETHGPSASGKTTIVGTTSGNKTIPGTNVVIGLNAYIKN